MQAGAPQDLKPRAAILCIGARNRLDEAAAVMLAHLLAGCGLARVLSNSAVSVSNLGTVERDGVAAVCLSYVQPEALHHARRLIRRLRYHFPTGVPILLGLWNAKPWVEGARDIRERWMLIVSPSR